MTFDQWLNAKRHELRIAFMVEHHCCTPKNCAIAEYYDAWLRERYAAEHPTADPNGE